MNDIVDLNKKRLKKIVDALHEEVKKQNPDMVECDFKLYEKHIVDAENE